MVAMTSCSSDILSDGVNGPDSANGKKTLIVTQEGMVNGYTTTRAVADASTKLNWERGDMIKVYDGTVYMWDGYRFDGKAFTIFTDEDLAEGAAAYALYPFGSRDGVASLPTTLDAEGAYPALGGVFQTHWQKGGDITATMEIPTFLNYYEGVMNDGKTPAYWCNIPQWGTVKSTDGKLETDLKWMTAMLQVNLANVPGNARRMVITAWQEPAMIHNLKLSGNFVAVLDKENPENTQLETQDLGVASTPGDWTTVAFGAGDCLTIDLSEATKDKSVIYVPIATMRNAVIKIQYYDALLTEITDGSNAPKILKQKNYERGKYYPTKEYNLGIAGTTPSAITKVLASESWQSEAEGGVATLTTTRTTNVTPSGVIGAEDYIIEIPKMSGESTIVLNLEGYDYGKLLIQDVKAEDPFTGTVVLNVKNNNGEDIEINLPGATVELKGDYDAQTKVFANSLAVAQQDVKDADDTPWTATTLTSLDAAGTKNYTIGEGISQGAFTGTAELESLTVNGTITGPIDVTASNATVTVAGTKDTPANTGAITAKGAVSVSYATTGALTSQKGDVSVANSTVGGTVSAPEGNITFAESSVGANNLSAPKGKVTVTGISTCGAITAGNGVDITAAVDADDATKHTAIASILASKGDVNISGKALTASGTITATKGNVTISGENDLTAAGLITAGEKFTLTGKSKAANVTAKTAEINVDGNDNNFAAVTGNLSVKSNMTLTQGYIGTIANTSSSAITVTLGDKYNAVKSTTGTVNFTESKWNNAVAVASKDIKDYIDANIYTATQLAFIDKVATAPAAGFKLQNNIDLNNGNKWPMPALKCNFDGNNKTIKNLKVVSTNNNGAGLFLNTPSTAAVTIQRLTIDGADVQGKSGKGNVGTLVGKAGNDITVIAVTIKNASVTVAGNADNVGGFIGYAVGKSTFGDGSSNITGTFTKIQGRNNLGGLVGKADQQFDIKKAAITIDAFESNGAVESPNVVTDEADADRGSVGMYVGRVEAGTSNIDATIKTADGKAVSDNRIALGFRMNFSVNTTDNKFYFYCGNGGTEVGMVKGTSTTVKIASKTYNAMTGVHYVATVADIADETTPAYDNYVKAGAEDYK